MIWLLSTPLLLPHATFLLAQTQFFFFPVLQRLLLLERLSVLGLKSSSHRGFILAGSQLKYYLIKRKEQHPHLYSLTCHWACMHNNLHCLEVSCPYLLTCIVCASVPYNLLKQLDSKDFVYAVIKGPRSGSGPLQTINRRRKQ